MTATTPLTRGPWLLLVSGVLALLGLGALLAASLVPPTQAAAPAVETPSPTPRAIPTVGADPIAAEVDVAERPIAELADPEWVAAMSAAAGIPERALAAYAGAALAVGDSDPTCGIGWNTIAAIGHVESEHGTLGGSRIGDDGVAEPRIIGIALDGNGVDAIADTDRGELDGDTVWDRAVGPMQFIPSTWALLARDGDSDGETDIDDIDDAALAAAVHLCEVGGDLNIAENWIAAVGAYNASVDYNNRVADAANHYASLVIR